MQAIQGGDDSALNELIDRHREPLFRFVYRYLHNESAARDVVQEAFVRTYFKAKSFQPQCLVKTWIYSIALNLCRDRARSLGRRPQSVSLNAEPALRPVEIADSSPRPDEHLNSQDRLSALEMAIASLPHKLRAALVLFAIEGYSQREIAQMLDTTPKTVELRVAHAKQKLRSILSNSQILEDSRSPSAQ